MKADSREYPRASVRAPIWYYQWNEPKSAEGLELSAGGIFLRTEATLPEGTMLTLRLAMPGLARAITVLGQVVRTVKGSVVKPSGMGVRFLDLLPTERTALVAFVNQRHFATV